MILKDNIVRHSITGVLHPWKSGQNQDKILAITFMLLHHFTSTAVSCPVSHLLPNRACRTIVNTGFFVVAQNMLAKQRSPCLCCSAVVYFSSAHSRSFVRRWVCLHDKGRLTTSVSPAECTNSGLAVHLTDFSNLSIWTIKIFLKV